VTRNRRYTPGRVLAITVLLAAMSTHAVAFKLWNPVPANPDAAAPRMRWCPKGDPAPPGYVPRMPIEYYVNPKDSDLGSATLSIVQDAVAAWVNLGGSDITFDFKGQLSGDTGRGSITDNLNTISFGDFRDDLPSGTLGLAFFWFELETTVTISAGREFLAMTEFDIVMNDRKVNFGTRAQVEQNSSLFDEQGVITHELGHALGFAHSSDDPSESNPVKRDATMYWSMVKGDTSKETPNSDDRDAANFAYTGSPTVTSVDPTEGPADGGTSLTVNGTGFVRKSEYYETVRHNGIDWINGFSQGPGVRIGGEWCTNVQVDSTQRITCTVPPLLPGTYDVRVVNPDGRSDSLSAAYTSVGAGVPDLDVDADSVTLTETNPAAAVTVTNSGGGTLRWHVSSDDLTVSPTAGTGDSIVTIETLDFTVAHQTAVTFTNDDDPADSETVTVYVLKGLDTDRDGIIDTVDDDDDGDGLTDDDELGRGTDPLDSDTDHDTMPDGYEVSYELDPTVDDTGADADGDGVVNGDEYVWGTSPRASDTDGDGYTDKEEIDRGTSPTDDTDTPEPWLTNVAIQPENPRVWVNTPFTFSVTAEMSDGSIADLSSATVTWEILSGIGSIDQNEGVYESDAAGGAEIQVTAELDRAQASSTLRFIVVAPSLAIGSGNIVGDETVAMGVTLTCAGREVAAIEFLLVIDSQVVELVNIELSGEISTGDNTLDVTLLDEDRFFVRLSTNDGVLSDGTVLLINLKTAPSGQKGQRSPLLCEEQAFYGSQGSDIDAVGIDGVCWVGLPGDVDGGGFVDAVDVQLVINRALGIEVTWICDINGDDVVDAVDVQLVINAALGIV